MRYLILIISLGFFSMLSGQNPIPLPSGPVVELEAAQSPVTSTIIVATSERKTPISKIFLYRKEITSNDWVLIDSIYPEGSVYEIPDPTVTVDDEGNFYLVIMRVSKPSGPFPWRANLNIVKSEDDGKWWNGLNAPHSGDGLADYPQIISSGKNLYLVYSHIHEFPIQTNASFTFKKSENEGSRWSSAIVLDAPNLSAIGPDITMWGQDRILATCGNRNSNYLYCFESSDEGENWNFLDSLLQPTGENACITKPIARKEFDHFAVLAHRAHMDDTPISFHFVNGNQKNSKFLSNGAYAQGWMDETGDIHVTYNKKEGTDFKVQYFKVKDLGKTFSQEITLYSGTYEQSKLGEYQSFFKGEDGNFHLIFCDWSDDSKAKHLIFSPDISKVKEAKSTPIQIFPNPAKDFIRIYNHEEEGPFKLSIKDVAGKVIKSKSFDSKIDDLEINVGDLSQGSYLLLFESKHAIRVSKFIKS